MTSSQNLKIIFHWDRFRRAIRRREACVIVFAILAFCAHAFALDPPPAGGYPNKVTALGQNALFDLTMGGG